MKLQYRETKWADAETGIQIAPQDQEKVSDFIYQQEWNANRINAKFKWQPEIGKLYDSGDLVFELKQFVHCTNESWIEPKFCDTCKNAECGCDIKQFWVLKEKAKEEKKEWRCEGGYKFCQKDDQGNCSCKKPSEAKDIEIPTTNSIHRKEIEQLQSRIAELEDSPEYVKGHADGYLDGYAQAKKELEEQIPKNPCTNG